MAVKDFRVRYAATIYEHNGGGMVSPYSFRRALERDDGTTVEGCSGKLIAVDASDPDSAFRYLTDYIFDNRWPDETMRLVDDAPQDRAEG